MKPTKTDKRSVPPGYQLVPPDGGIGWLMVACSVFIGVITSIPILAIGLLLPDIIQATGSTTATASWIPAMAFSVGLIVAPINILFTEKYSHRTSSMVGGILMTLGLSLSYFGNHIGVLFFTYGILFGIGFGITSNASTLILNHYFSKRYGQAIGYVMASHSLSRLIFAPLIELMIERYDYQGVFLILGGMSANCVVASALFHPAESHCKLKLIEMKPAADKCSDEKGKEVTNALLENGNDGEAPARPLKEDDGDCWSWCSSGPLKILNFSQLKHPIFYLLFFSNLIIFTMAVYINVFLPSLILENGLTPMQAALVQSARSGGEVAGRIFVPWIQVQFQINLRGYYIGMSAIQAVLLIIIIFLSDSTAAIITASAIGFTSGGVIGLSVVMMVQCVGLLKMGATYSLVMFLNGFISLGFGPLIGFLRDVLGTFSPCFYVLASAQLLNCFLWLIKPCIIPQNQSQNNK